VNSDQVILNEFLADPGGVDVNKDGEDSATQDEFLEIVILGTDGVNMQGVEVQINGNIKHTFDDPCMHPGTILLFSGGTPAIDQFPHAAVHVSDKALSMTNSGAEIRIVGPNGDLDAYTYGPEGGSDQSLTRSPDLTGDFFLHTEALGSFAAPMSPGTCINGGALPECQGSCVPNCTLPDGTPKDCGEDGCGGFCGPDCEGGQACVNGICGCVPDCTFSDGSAKECGSDGCGGTCGPITEAGCCAANTVYYCAANLVMTIDCSVVAEPGFEKCGWVEEMSFYDCTSESSADPDGIHPISCEP